MSFILDAIAKSEHERQRQEVPDARSLALPAGNEQRPRRVWPYLVVAALLLNVIVLSVWMQSDRFLPNPVSLSQGETIEQPVEQALVADSLRAKNWVPSGDGGNKATSTKSTAGVGNSASKHDAANTPSPESFAQSQTTVSTSKSQIERKGETISELGDTQAHLDGASELTSPRAVAASKTREDIARLRIEPDKSSTKFSPGRRANQSSGGLDTGAEVMPRKVSRLSELPADVRRDLPPVDFSGHLYSSNPELSYVLVNGGRAVSEGRQIADGLYLYKITPTGVIVEFRGYLIDVGVLQNWNLN